MGLRVLQPGLWATVQDLGRPGYRAWGVPIGGAFDLDAHTLANALVGNSPREATLELTLIGGLYEAESPLALALAGAPMEAAIVAADGARRPLVVPQSFSLRPGDRLQLGGTPRGARAYLAARGGWPTREVLGSRSSETALAPGDLLPAAPGEAPALRPAFAVRPEGESGPFRVVASAAEVDWGPLTFRVAPQSDRMGLRLEGPAPAVAPDPDRLSAPVAPGALQVAGGRLIVLGPACGTMGGYPVLAHVVTADLPRLGQLRPGDPLRFLPLSLADARRLDREHRRRRDAWALTTSARSGCGPVGEGKEGRSPGGGLA